MNNSQPPQIKLKTQEELQILRDAAKILSTIIKDLIRSLTIGQKTKDVDDLASRLIKEQGVKPAFKGYRGFPKCLCISLNQEVVHGIPGEKIISDGDIISLDLGTIYEGYYADMAVTVGVGNIDQRKSKLIDVAKSCLHQGIGKAKMGNRLSDISHAIQSCAESKGFSVVRDFVGHGIGRNLHEEPEIPNYGPAHCGPILQEGMVFCLEPMINLGTWQTKILDDGWTVETVDGKASAHFEHMVAVTKKGPEILTQF